MREPAASVPLRDRHLFTPGPKRILALDGGGARGMLTLAFLERLEAFLGERTGLGARLRLADYFDLIGGTSIGALLAAGLALRRPVSQLIALFQDVCRDVFRPSFFSFGGLLAPKFSAETLRAILAREMADITLGSELIATGLAIVAKRLDTGSVWILHNNPNGRYFDRRDPGGSFTPNKDLLLRHVVQASAAAPTYFQPQLLRVADDTEGFFLDGGVSPYNNPALLLLMLATSKGFNFNWRTGEDNLFVLSLGTGSVPRRHMAAELDRAPTALMGVQALTSLIEDGSVHSQAMLQWMARSTNPRVIDREIGDLADSWPLPERLLTYSRLDLDFERQGLKDGFDIDLDEATLSRFRSFDDPSVVDLLLDIGRRAAPKLVGDRTLPPRFDAGIVGTGRVPD
jgi:hypothetical protein